MHVEIVVAKAAVHDVVAGAADQEIVAGRRSDHVRAALAAKEVHAVVAGQPVGEIIGLQIERVGRAKIGRLERFDILQTGEDEADRRRDPVVALARNLNHGVAGIVDIIGVVAGVSGHRIRARAADHEIVAGAARQHVVAVAAVHAGRRRRRR